MMKYEVGDYVRIRKDISQDEDGVVEEMEQYAGQLAKIVDIDIDSYNNNDMPYKIDIDNQEWWWSDELFEYRLGNYEDNKIENSHFTYVIGYKRNKGVTSVKKFIGYIENFAPCGKSAFINDSGEILVLPWDMIEYIIPTEKEK